MPTRNRREVLVVLIALSMLGGFLTGLFLWGAINKPEVVAVAEPTLPNPYIDVQINTPLPIPTPTAEPEVVDLRARLSHYYPAWGGANCHPANWNGTECTALLTNGQAGYWQHWSYYEDWGTACPREFKLGTRFSIEGFGTWTCVDRGGAIQMLPDGTFFLDLLTKEQPYVRGGEVVRDKFSPAGSYVVTVTLLD